MLSLSGSWVSRMNAQVSNSKVIMLETPVLELVIRQRRETIGGVTDRCGRQGADLRAAADRRLTTGNACDGSLMIQHHHVLALAD